MSNWPARKGTHSPWKTSGAPTCHCRQLEPGDAYLAFFGAMPRSAGGLDQTCAMPPSTGSEAPVM
jgi:hypothetical protein